MSAGALRKARGHSGPGGVSEAGDGPCHAGSPPDPAKPHFATPDSRRCPGFRNSWPRHGKGAGACCPRTGAARIFTRRDG